MSGLFLYLILYLIIPSFPLATPFHLPCNPLDLRSSLLPLLQLCTPTLGLRSAYAKEV